MIVDCIFGVFSQSHSSSVYYTCQVKNQEITGDEGDFDFQGNHFNGRSNDGVKWLHFFDCTIPKMPNGLSKIFKNLEVLTIKDSKLKSITKLDLQEFKNLKSLDLTGNKIEFLPGDLFQATRNIEKIRLTWNRIKVIEPELLENLPKLKYVDLTKNVNISCFYNEAYQQGNAPRITLEQLKSKIRQDCKPSAMRRFPSNPDFNVRGRQGLKFEIRPPKPPPRTTTSAKSANFLEGISDFTMKVGDEDFKIHKFIFASRSDTFAELIKENPDAESLDLQYIPIETFKCVLSYVYTDQLPETKNIHDVFAAATKLKINSLIKITEKLLILTLENQKNLEVLFKTFSLANKFQHNELKLGAFKEIQKHFPGRQLKEELLTQPEKLKKLIEAKILLDRHLDNLEI